jgi:hypothetical protein
MNLLLPLLLLVAVVPNQNDTRHPDAVVIFECQFDRPWDVNYDDWPDNWRRTLGPKMPHYVNAKIAADPARPDNSSLTIDVNGGGVHLESPQVTVSHNFSYKAECQLLAEGLESTQVQFRVEFLDDQEQVLQTDSSVWVTKTQGWQRVHIGPVYPKDNRITAARLVLHVEPGDRADLKGRVAFDDLWMARLPQMNVSTGSPCNVYTDPKDIEVTCSLSGILDSDPDIVFELFDASSQQLDESRIQLQGTLITERRRKASEFVGVTETQRAAYAGVTSWRPPITKHGFYKVCVTMQNSRGMFDHRIVNIALVPPLDRPEQGEFGWSLAGDEVPLSLDNLGQLLPLMAVNWVKLPVWYGESEVQRGDELVMFAEKAAAQHIDVVGVVDRPPAESDLAKRLARDATIADILATDSSSWLPLLDPVLQRLSLRVRWWQLGEDHDSSLSRVPKLDETVVALRDKLFRFGQDVNLGIGWKWLQTSTGTNAAPWEFQQYSASPPLTGQELESYLALPVRKNVRRWVVVEPLSRRRYDLETRARDLVEQMLAAKIYGATAIFAARPFDDDTGLMTEQGMPGELLLPWRTTASLLSGTKYLGNIELPRHSHNRLFETPGGEVLMVVWSDSPAEELLQLGDDVRVLDVWGRQQPIRRDGERLLIAVDAMPKFVLGLNASIARWGMAVRFDELNVPSVFGKAHPNRIELVNTFAQGVGGTVRLIAPEGWQISPERIDFKLGVGETVFKPFDVSLPFDASGGPAPIRAEFSVDADRPYRFSVDRELTVGDGLVQIETSTRIDEDGSLIVTQRMVNHAPKPVDFKCLMYAPGRRRQRMQVFRLGANPDNKTYRYPDGAQLIGAELWLRAEEVNGSRVVNHRFIVEQ